MIGDPKKWATVAVTAAAGIMGVSGAISVGQRQIDDAPPRARGAMTEQAPPVPISPAPPMGEEPTQTETGKILKAHAASLLTTMGLVMGGTGHRDLMDQSLRAALRLRRETLGDDHSRTVKAISNLACVRMEDGDYVEAEVLFREALAILESRNGDACPDKAVVLSNLADLFVEKGDYVRAIPFLENALAMSRDVFGPADRRIAAILHNLGVSLGEDHKYSQAEGALREALMILRDLSVEPDESIGTTLNSLATVLIEEGNCTEAESLLNEALAIDRRVFWGAHLSAAMTLNNLASLHQANNEPMQAEVLYRQALDIARRSNGNVHPKVPALLENLATVLANRGDYHGAASLLYEAMDIAERLRTDIVGNALERAAFAGKNRLPTTARSLSIVLMHLDQMNEAFDAAERGRARAILDLAMRSQPGLMAKMRDGRPNGVAAQLDSTLDEATSMPAPLQALLPDAKPMTTEQIRDILEPGELIISYCALKHEIALLIVPPSGEGLVDGISIAQGEAAVWTLWDDVNRLTQAISQGPEYQEPRGAQSQLLCRLSDALFPIQIRPRILAARRLIVIADSQLMRIPFEMFALPQCPPDSEGSLLLEHGPQIVYADSGTTFAHRRKEGRALRNANHGRAFSATILANPDLTNWRSDTLLPHGASQFRPLPNMEAAANNIAALLREARGTPEVLAGSKANLSMLEAAVENDRFVVILAHAVMGSRERPYDAGLPLYQSQQATRQHTGFLSLDHMIRHWHGRLRGCDLVMLPDCNTQRGVFVTESLFALSMGFMYAGATTVVASLWETNEAAAGLLATRFFENLLGQVDQPRTVGGRQYAANEPMSKGDALREAKQWLRRLRRSEIQTHYSDTTLGTVISTSKAPASEYPFEDPYYWAPFVLLGDPE